MPYQVLVNTNINAPYLEIEFIDAENNKISTPTGATVNFTSSDTNLVGITNDPGNELRGKITLGNVPEYAIASQVSVTVHIDGANDIDGSPFVDKVISATLNPPVPAKPASILFWTTP